MKKTFITLLLAFSLILAKPAVAFAPLLYWVGASAVVHIAGFLGYYFLFTNTSTQSNLVYVTTVDTSTGEVNLEDIETLDATATASFKSTITAGGTYNSAKGPVTSSNYAEEYNQDPVTSGAYYYGDKVYGVYTGSAIVPDPVYVRVTSGNAHYYWADQSTVAYMLAKVGWLFSLINYPQGASYDSGSIIAYVESVNSTTGLVVFREVGTVSASGAYIFDNDMWNGARSYTYTNYLTGQSVTVSRANYWAAAENSFGKLEVDIGVTLSQGGIAFGGTCSDGIQNQNETGIDTGGVCGGASGGTALLDYLQAGDGSSYYSGDYGFDASLSQVAKGSITNTLTNFISSNPVVSIFTGSSITAVDGTCSISGSFWGKSVTADFCWLESSMNALGVFVFMIAGIYSFFIAWGRA